MSCTVLLYAGAAAALPQPAAAPPVAGWNALNLAAVKEEARPPGLTSRHLALLHLAIFEAANAPAGRFCPYLDPPEAPAGPVEPVVAAAHAAHTISVAVFPGAKRARFDRLLREQMGRLRADFDPAVFDASATFGRAVATRLLEARQADRANLRITYLPRDGPGQWRRTPPAFRPPEAPHWGRVTPFVIGDPAAFRPAGPPPMDGEVFAAALAQIRSLGAGGSSARTPEQTRVAHFWSDFSYTVTPPGHWNVIARQALAGRGLDLVEEARVFALLNLALADAGIVAFETKYHYNYWRPITAIRRADEDGNTATATDPDWEPLLESPPHPEYVSAHSCFSGAAARLLALALGGDDVRFTVGCDALPGVTRTFERFSDAAEEIGMSRLYGGIHYRFSNRDGLDAGAKVAEHVFAHALRPAGSD